MLLIIIMCSKDGACFFLRWYFSITLTSYGIFSNNQSSSVFCKQVTCKGWSNQSNTKVTCRCLSHDLSFNGWCKKNMLCCNYKKALFGEGAKRSSSSNTIITTTGTEGRVNIWWSQLNHRNLCIEGSVFNMLCHMNMMDAAENICSIAVHQTRQMNKNYKTSIGSEICFNCVRFGCLNVNKFSASHTGAKGVLMIQLPVIMSILEKHCCCCMETGNMD